VEANDASACCDEPTGPNTPAPGISGPGGGRVGAVLLSPCIRPTTSSRRTTSPCCSGSEEKIFGLGYLGYAVQSGLATFGRSIFNRPWADESVVPPRS
jgi:phosphatidylinositol-3-phosphatase